MNLWKVFIKRQILTKRNVYWNKVKSEVWNSLQSYCSIRKAVFFQIVKNLSVVFNLHIPTFSLLIPNNRVTPFGLISLYSFFDLCIKEIGKFDDEVVWANQLKGNIGLFIFLLLFFLELLLYFPPWNKLFFHLSVHFMTKNIFRILKFSNLFFPSWKAVSQRKAITLHVPWNIILNGVLVTSIALVKFCRDFPILTYLAVRHWKCGC